MELKDCFIWGHRGDSARGPENTLAAFRLAEQAGADGIELDVRLSRDGVPVVIHDESVDRTTDGKGAVADLTLRQLRRLDAGSWFSTSFAEERLPTLEDVLQWAGERLRLNLEIKSPDAAQAVLALLGGYPRSRVLLSSFDHRMLTSLHYRAPHLHLAFLCDSLFWRRTLKKAVHSKAAAFHPSARLVSRPLVVAARRAGIAVHPWTVDDPALARKLLRVGCSGIFTNDPASLTR